MSRSDTIELLVILGKIAALLMSVHYSNPVADNIRSRIASTILKWQKSVSTIYLPILRTYPSYFMKISSSSRVGSP